MQIEHKMKIYSNEAYLVVKKITVGKKRHTLFDATIRKMSVLISLTNKEQVYPLCKLLEIKQQIDEIQEQVEAAIKKIEQQLTDKKINPEQYNFTVKDEIMVKFGNPLIYQLIKVIEQFDRLICLLSLAKNTGITLSKRLYFTEKDKYQQELFRFLSSIIQYSIKDLPRVNINDVINETDIYINAAKLAGTFDLGLLHTAHQLNLISRWDDKKQGAYKTNQEIINNVQANDL